MKIYVSPAGKTAMLADNFLERAREEFGFDLAFILTNATRTVQMYEKLCKENVVILPISDPILGIADYMPIVRRIVKKILQLCPNPELIVVNSSGGTEKMTNIIKDVGTILELKFPVIRVWGVFDKVIKDVVFNVKPVLDAEAELAAAVNEVEHLRKELQYDDTVDIN